MEQLGSAFLCAEAGIDNSDLISNSAAYLNSWLQALRNDPEMLIYAASKATKAVDYMLGRQSQEQEPEQ